MIICSFCGTTNRVGIYFCEECGNPFLQAAASQQPNPTTATEPTSEQGTQKLHTQILKGAPQFSSIPVGTTMLRASAKLVLHILSDDERIIIDGADEFILGRTTDHADLDLSPYNASESGVSRRHALIRRGEANVSMIDLDSANGTYINGQKLIPQQPHILRDGDEVSFGKLVARIYFM